MARTTRSRSTPTRRPAPSCSLDTTSCRSRVAVSESPRTGYPAAEEVDHGGRRRRKLYRPVASNSARPEWLVVASNKFTRMIGQRVQTSAPGGPGPLPPPAPPGAVPNPRMWLDFPGPNSSVQPTFTVAGWAVDLWSVVRHRCRNRARVGVPCDRRRCDVPRRREYGSGSARHASYFGKSELASAGFSLSATLSPGVYDVVAFSFSSISRSFNASSGQRVTVVQPASNPKMSIDSPIQNQTVTQFFNLSGWAVDLASSTGCGVSALHVWAYPTAGGSPIFVGATTTGGSRPDVGSHFGAARFGTSGYSLAGNLPSGQCTLVVFAFSTVTGTLNQAAVVPTSESSSPRCKSCVASTRTMRPAARRGEREDCCGELAQADSRLWSAAEG